MTTATPILPNWTINSLSAQRIEIESRWVSDFDKNCITVAEKIATSITKEVFATIEKLFSGYYTLPSKSLGISLEFSLDLQKNLSSIKNWAQDGAALAPFCEWFNHFETSDCNLAHLEKKNIQELYMSKIRKLVFADIEHNLSTFQKRPDNQSLTIYAAEYPLHVADHNVIFVNLYINEDGKPKA